MSYLKEEIMNRYLLLQTLGWQNFSVDCNIHKWCQSENNLGLVDLIVFVVTSTHPCHWSMKTAHTMANECRDWIPIEFYL